MIKIMTICSFDDLLGHAQSIGVNWNLAHELLVEARLYIGSLTSDHYKDGAYCEPGEHIEARRILKSFMKQHQVEYIYITPKHYDC